MESLEAELERARALSVDDLADAIESIGFECTRCGACCTGHGVDEHTATVFPDEIRRLRDADLGTGEADADGPKRVAAPSNETGTVDADGTDGADADESVDAATVGDQDSAATASDHDSVAAADSHDSAATADNHDSTATADNHDSTATADVPSRSERDWRDVARPMPYGLAERDGDLEGETFEWALQTDACGDCVFYAEDEAGVGACVAHADRPLICRTYPFSVDLAGTSQPMGEAVDSVALPRQRETGDESGVVRAHECEGLGRDISRTDAEALARTLRERAIRDLEEAIAVRDAYEPVAPGPGEVVVHDSEGAKRIDGSPVEDGE